LTEADIRDSMREIRMALLEADVNYKVARDFIKTVSEKALGSDVLESLTPAQQIVKIVNDELVALMGGANEKLNMSSKPPTVVMLVGLQGAGKTTNGTKLAGYYKKQHNKRPLMVACDVYRPAAIQQLEIAASKLEIPVFQQGQGDPVAIAKAGIEHARTHGNDMVFIDTAGRLHIDEQLMGELQRIKEAVNPNEIMLVVDAMTGQDAVTAASAFNEALDIHGVLMTKLDGDARGGAALSVRAVTGKPIKFIGVGEKLDTIELFHPDRMASRILGMGDVLSLIEKAQATIDEKKAEELEKKLRSSQFTLEDYRDQIVQMKKMGSIQDIVGMIPGVKPNQLKDIKVDDRQIPRMEAIILSMTPEERANPAILNFNRKKRIAAGCGQKVEDVNRMLKQYEMIKTMTKQLSSGKMPANMNALAGMNMMKKSGGKKTFAGKGGSKFKLPF